MLKFLYEDEAFYSSLIDPHYLERRQPNIRWNMRTLLISWMKDVLADFLFKNNTLHMAVHFVDRFLSATSEVLRARLQLIGLTALIIATKMEEVYLPRIKDFAMTAENYYTCEEIVDMERTMLKVQKFQTSPPTMTIWANWFTVQWDLYIETSVNATNHYLVRRSNKKVHFRQTNNESYYRYRTQIQLLDTAIMDIQTLQYNFRDLVAAFMYIILGRDYEQFSSEQIVNSFPQQSTYLQETTMAFNNQYADFISTHFGCELDQLLPYIQYASTYFALELSFDIPAAQSSDQDQILQGHFENFISYQTINPASLDYVIRERNRHLV